LPALLTDPHPGCAQLVRRVEAATGTITTIAQGWQFPGSFTAFPSALAISPKGTLAIVDNNNHVVSSKRKPGMSHPCLQPFA
jgi:hypothetical protein